MSKTVKPNQKAQRMSLLIVTLIAFCFSLSMMTQSAHALSVTCHPAAPLDTTQSHRTYRCYTDVYLDNSVSDWTVSSGANVLFEMQNTFIISVQYCRSVTVTAYVDYTSARTTIDNNKTDSGHPIC